MFVTDYILKSIETKQKLLANEKIIENIKKVSAAMVNAYIDGKKIIFAGNGGSAADSQHLACELVSKFYLERKALNAITLTTNTSVLTAIGNDYSFDQVFARQIEAYGNSGDIFVALSTSGNSKNIIWALEQAKKQNIVCVGLTGEKSNKMDELCDIMIKVPSDETPIVQESHIMIGHIICALVEGNMQPK